jgi:putative methyltransferase (TIGR04325 family)
MAAGGARWLASRCAQVGERLAGTDRNVWPRFANFASASGRDAYGDDDVAAVVAAKTAELRLRQRETGEPVLVSSRQALEDLFVARLCARPSGLNVFDLGGACGAWLDRVDVAFGGLVQRYALVETAGMVAHAKPLRSADPRVCLTTDLAEAKSFLGEIDLVVASGVANYLPDPIAIILELVRLQPRYIYLTRTLVSSSEQGAIYTRQRSLLSEHGPGPMPAGFCDRVTQQAMTIPTEDAVQGALNSLGSIRIRFEEGQPRTMRIGEKSVRVCDIGLLGARTEVVR